jgi:O-succinylhomoserine (thiol)-lyase
MASRKKKESLRFNTLAVHTGVDKDKTYNSVITPIYPSSTFRFNKPGEPPPFDYTRSGNPTRAALSENVAALEGGVAGWATCTGMAAETSILFLLRTGDHLIAPHDLYGGSFRLMHTAFARMGVETTFVDQTDLAKVRDAIRPNTRMLWIETPSNPILRVVDIPAVVEIARKRKLITVADNTFLSPYFQRPLELGVDIVFHSTTKYINGHSDVVGGVIVVGKRGKLHDGLDFNVNALGTGCSPFDAWLVLRGVKTLGPRMEAHQRSAMAVAEFLAGSRKVKTVYYPGLKSDPYHKLARKQQRGFGGMVSFDLRGGKSAANKLCRSVRLFSLAESLGGVESLIDHPDTMTHASMTPEARQAAGITPGTIRLSCGIEDPQDLVDDLKVALARL